MALPSNVGFGTVTGRFIRATADSTRDGDSDPDGVPLGGLKIVFRSSISRAKNPSATPPVTIIFDTVQAMTDADGVLTDPDGNASIRLIATDDTDLQPSGWTWTATITGPTIETISSTFTLSEGETVDLTTVIEVPASPGKDLPAWQAAVDAVEAARGGMVVGGTVSGDSLVLTTLDGTQMTAGNVRGPKGDTGGTVVQVGTGLTASGAGTAASPLVIAQADTGWRDVSSMLMNGWTATTVRARRIGNTVYFRPRGLNGKAATSPVFADLSSLVAEDPAADAIGIVLPGSPSFGYAYQWGGQGLWKWSGSVNYTEWVATTYFSPVVAIPTSKPYPTTLPGTPA